MRALLAGLLAVSAFAADDKGLRARPSPDDYPAQRAEQKLTVGAALLSREEVKNSFATGLVPHYIVVEVAVYPGSGPVELKPDDFVLRVGTTRAVVRPVEGRTIAARLHRKTNDAQRQASSPSDITVYPTVGVGVGSGPSYPDGRRTSGVSTGVGVGVGVGGAGGPTNMPPASTDADRKTMETELSDKALPEQRITTPVAGYLYFPVTTSEKRKQTSYELEYTGTASRFTLRLPIPREK